MCLHVRGGVRACVRACVRAGGRAELFTLNAGSVCLFARLSQPEQASSATPGSSTHSATQQEAQPTQKQKPTKRSNSSHPDAPNAVGFSTFKRAWTAYCSHIGRASTRTDMCNTCMEFRQKQASLCSSQICRRKGTPPPHVCCFRHHVLNTPASIPSSV